MPLLSIIVPVYNVEKYLDECLESIANQTFKDIEVICVDDGSTDNSAFILNAWKKKDKRFVVVRQRNGGLSAARNRGISLASGEYIGFVDSDDMVSATMYSTMMDLTEKHSLDVVGCSFKTFPDRVKSNFSFVANKKVNCKELLQTTKSLQSSNDMCFVWRYVIRRSLLIQNQILFNENVLIGEDMIFMIDVLMNCRQIMVINDALYYYRKNNGSSLMTTATYNPNLIDSYSLLYQIKKKQISTYNIDQYTPYSFDLAVYTINVYLPLFLKNIFANTKILDKESEIKRILSLPMIRDACKIIGFKNVYTTWKEYFFYLLLKWQIDPILIKYYMKNHKQ